MKQEKFPRSNAFILEMKQLNAMKSMTQSRSPPYASKEMGSYCMDPLADGPISYNRKISLSAPFPRLSSPAKSALSRCLCHSQRTPHSFQVV